MSTSPFSRQLFPMAILVLFVTLGAASAGAHSVVVDGDPGDWATAPGIGPDLGILVQGEYIWEDAAGDERTDFAVPDATADLREFRVTADVQGLYFLARLSDLVATVGEGAVQLQIAIDTDGIFGSGEVWLGGFADTQVAPAVAWEYLIVTRLGSGSATPNVWDTTWSDLATPATAVSQASAVNDCVEIFVAWSALGGVPIAPVRFSLAVLRANAFDEAWDIVGSSDVLDAATNYGDPGSTANTWNEVGDGIIDANFELWFHLGVDPEPSTPLLISEILYDAIGAEPAGEWVEIVNLSAATIPLEGYMIGDEETPDGTEGMMVFPAGGLIDANDVVVVANNAAEFLLNWSQAADFEMVNGDVAVPTLAKATTWATGIPMLGNSGDQVLLLDPSGTILDVVTYESAVYPGVIAALGAIADQSIARMGVVDTDDCSSDFMVLDVPTPGEGGTATAAPSELASRTVILHQNQPNPFNPVTTIVFELQRPERVSVAVYDVAGRLVATLIGDEPHTAGRPEAVWRGVDDGGRPVASGTYFYRLDAGEHSEMGKMALVR